MQAELAEEEKQAMAEELEMLQQAVTERESELLSVRHELTELEDRLPVHFPCCIIQDMPSIT